MKRTITLTAFICLSYVAILVAQTIYPPNKILHNYHALNSATEDEQYVVFPTGESWSILFPNGGIEQDLTPEQIGHFFKTGEVDRENVIELTNGSEYQMSVTDEYILLKDGNRQVSKLPIEQTGQLEQVIFTDNL